MNRREFGKLILGTGATAALPGSVIAGTSAATAQRSKYIFAVALAHAHIDVSAGALVDKFKVTPTTARALMDKLVRNGVVDPPNAAGIARLAEPLQRIVPQVVEYNPAGGYIIKGPLDELTGKIKKATADALKSDAEEVLDASPSEDFAGEVVPPEEGTDESEAEEISASEQDQI